MYLHNKMTKLLFFLTLGVGIASAQVKIAAGESRIHVEIDGKPYADFVVKSDEAMKPYLFPLRAASGTIVTRHWPMEKVAAVELASTPCRNALVRPPTQGVMLPPSLKAIE